MFGILRVILSGTREVIGEQMSKRSLEKKLGRKVSKDELYSLGAHLDAAEPQVSPPNAFQPSFPSAPRESAVPFADAKPPMKTRTKLLIAGVLVLVLGVIGVVAAVGFVLVFVPPATYNKFNPFIPKPAPGDFPAQIGRFTRSTEPSYLSSSYSDKLTDAYHYSYYNAADPDNPGKRDADAANLKLYVWHFKTADEARRGLEEIKQEYKKYNDYQFVDDTDARFALVNYKGGSTSVIWTDGTKLRRLSGASQKTIYEFEGLLKKNAPVALVDVKLNGSDTPGGSTNDSAVTVLRLLDDYKNDPTAADAKYKGKIITVVGKTEVVDKDKQGNPMIAFMRPGSTKPADGMIVCSFDKSKAASLAAVKKGDYVRLQGRVSMNLLFSVMLENCSKL